jgi:hypothetical protein
MRRPRNHTISTEPPGAITSAVRHIGWASLNLVCCGAMETVAQIVCLPLFLTGVVLVIAAIAKFLTRSPSTGIASRTCPHCRQRVPDFGIFCPVCGKQMAVPAAPGYPPQ